MGFMGVHNLLRYKLQTHEYVTACYGKRSGRMGGQILLERLLRHSGNLKSEMIRRSVDCWVVQLKLGLTEVN